VAALPPVPVLPPVALLPPVPVLPPVALPPVPGLPPVPEAGVSLLAQEEKTVQSEIRAREPHADARRCLIQYSFDPF
jgi:hypothetical protein